MTPCIKHVYTISMNMQSALYTALLLCTASICPAANTATPSSAHKQNKHNITFHESWTPQQRADLLHMYHLLSVDLPKYMIQSAKASADISIDVDENDTSEQIAEKLSAALEENHRRAKEEEGSLAERAVARAATLPMRNLLKKTAATGRGDVYNKDGLSLAYLAIRLGMPELAKELVRRGADPNKRYYCGTDLHVAGPAYEDLLCAAVGQQPLCETAILTPEQAADMVQWLLANGADPNKSQLSMLSLCCQMEMILHNRSTCTTLILDKMHTLPAEQQAELAAALLWHVPGSWDTFEHFFRKGIFTRKGMEQNRSFFSTFTYCPDAPEKLEKLIAMGFDPNYTPPRRDRKEFKNDTEYEEYLDEYYEGERSPLLVLLTEIAFAEDEEEFSLQLQCMETLLRHGATAELEEFHLPQDEEKRAKILTLLRQYNIPVRSEEVETDEEEIEEDYEEDEDDNCEE